MTKRERKKTNRAARPIRTKRDRDGAADVVKKLSGQTDRDSAAEKRLAALLREMEKYDNAGDDPGDDFDEDDYSGPLRRWSDQD